MDEGVPTKEIRHTRGTVGGGRQGAKAGEDRLGIQPGIGDSSSSAQFATSTSP